MSISSTAGRTDPPPPPGPPAPAPHRKPLARWALPAAALAGLVTGLLICIWFPLLVPFAEPREKEDEGNPPGTVVVAHIADARISGDTTASGNGPALSEVLRALRARPGVPSAEAVVLSGQVLMELASATSASATPPTTTAAERSAQDSVVAAGDTTADAVRTQQTREGGGGAGTGGAAAGEGALTPTNGLDSAASVLSTLLAASPVSEVYLVPDAVLPAARLERIRAGAARSGVAVFDLTACHDSASVDPAGCRADLTGSRWALVGLPRMAGLDTAAARRAPDRLHDGVAAARRDGQRIVLVASALPPPDTATGTAGRQVDDIAGAGRVAAILTGHDAPETARGTRLVRTRPLGKPAAGTAGAGRGISMVLLSPAGVVAETLPFDAVAGRFTRTARPPQGERSATWVDRMRTLGEGLGEPGRTAVFWLAVLTAFLTVAALWEVPAPNTQTVAVVTAAPAPGAAGAPPTGGSTVVVEPAADSVFRSNLGRTVLSGLTGIAAVTILNQIWGMSGTAGQAFFTIVFVQLFLLMLLASALTRAVIEGIRHRVVAEYRPAMSFGERPLWRRLWLWLLSHRTSSVVAADTFTNVLLGRSWAKSGVWEIPVVEAQQTLLQTIHRVREGTSRAVLDALRESNPGVRETDFRVNISLLSTQAPELFYVSSARGASTKVFGQQSVAYISILSGEARWWKRTYLGGHRHLVSRARLRGPDGNVPEPHTPLAAVEIDDGAGGRHRLSGGAPIPTTVSGTFGNDDPIPSPAPLPSDATLGQWIAALNDTRSFGAGFHPALVSLDAHGHLLVADAELPAPNAAAGLSVTSLQLGTVEFGPLTPVTLENVLLFPAPPPARFTGHTGNIPITLEERGQMDYAAFMMIPVPLGARGQAQGTRRAAIHISFGRASMMDTLWRGLERGAGPGAIQPSYDEQEHLLDRSMLADPVLRTALRQGVSVLETVIQQFNESWFRSRGGLQS